MILSDRDIKARIAAGELVIDPVDLEDVQPASVDVRLDRKIVVFDRSNASHVDPTKPSQDNLTNYWTQRAQEPFILHPGEFVLGSTLEHIEIPADIVARIEGKSSLGRIGLLIHSTAGYVDPGWKGRLTLELSNISRLPIAIHPGMKIGQMSFMRMTSPAERPYGSPGLGSHYQGQTEATPSRLPEQVGNKHQSRTPASRCPKGGDPN